MREVTAGRLRSLLCYNPELGVFVRRLGVRGQSVGAKVGCRSKAIGYVIIGLDFRKYYAHRLAFLYMTGRWPVEVDHINGDRADNRWGNLRECDSSQNKANARRRKDNTSGIKGVSWDASRGLWRAQICKRGKRKSIGRFAMKDAATKAFCAAAEQLNGDFARFE